MRERIRVWEELQRAETLLVRNGARRYGELARRHAARYRIPSRYGSLLLRVGSGMDPAGFTAEQYRQRYPFSTVVEIRETFDALAAEGLFVPDGEGYRLSGRAVDAVRAWIGDAGEMIRLAQPGTIAEEEVRRLLRFDRQILAAMRSAGRPHDKVIFHLRCRGLQPEGSHGPGRPGGPDRPDGPVRPDGALWYHWQHVWTMIALHEDEEEHVRRHGGLDALAWFVRRQLWFLDRRPWLARAATAEELAARATQYSPVGSAPERVRAALRELARYGWLVDEDGRHRLSPAGLAAADRDEGQIDEGFLAAWPEFDEAAWRELDQLVGRINRELDAAAAA